ncbi:M1 family metallopeptidase [Paraflavitalea pollutisoli]|uniref:M1 family metallopeptidase n=1 Tax=Paraflavitalea pollutisoli TaxID=3034143 RepID=UPI0023EB8EBA|nr:M1 family metallopeptidase [Paraflavitalea sp. H1-2-19X]
MNIRLVIFIGLMLLQQVVRAQAYWQQEVHYIIDVELDDKANSLNGYLKLRYINHSPDSLNYIWFHLWPNAFKNDRTAFSDQLLLHGRTDFYFSDREDRGYINRLDFRTNNVTLETEDHPQYIDVVKVLLNRLLLPGAAIEITTPFHVKLPKNFSRGGHVGQSYQLTQWYPKPAVFDQRGWHPMPYLDQGEFYSEFGSYDVRITVPQDYIVAATGELQDANEKAWLRTKDGAYWLQHPETKPVTRAKFLAPPPKPVKKTGQGSSSTAKKTTVKKTTTSQGKKTAPGKKKPADDMPVPETPVAPQSPAVPTKTLRYKQDRVHDFAWFADKRFVVNTDTIQLPSGRTIEAWTFYKPGDKIWESSLRMAKDAIRFRSSLIGEYPYNVVSVVETSGDFNGGMEYPTITNIGPVDDTTSLDAVIEHEIGHNWFYGILASNERDHPWMDEGINSYYGDRYKAWKYPVPPVRNGLEQRLPADQAALLVAALVKEKKDQPISTPSAELSQQNYGAIAYFKTAQWMRQLEQTMGQPAFDTAMRRYYQQWQFRHPSPDDFRAVMAGSTSKDLNGLFRLLDTTGALPGGYTGPKKIKPAFLFSIKEYDRVNYVNFLPAMGYNMYDKFMVGLVLHNISIPTHDFQFILAPLYATNSKQLNGIGNINYTWRPNKTFNTIELGVTGSRFSTLDGVDSNGAKVFGGFHKVVPSLRFTFRNKSPLSTVEKWIEWKTYLIGEKGFRYVTDSDDSMTYPSPAAVRNRYLNQLTFNVTNYRKLYPYDAQLQVQQGEGFYRVNATGHYFFNYAKGGGLQVRAFAAKFGYLGGKTNQKYSNTYLYQPKLTAVRGDEDYTYSNYFIGRSEFDGAASQQIMVRDGGLKLRTDLFAGLQGRSDNWIASVNFNTTLPNKLLPFKLPVRVFLDIGTYADAWEKDAVTSRFLYVAGLQVSLFKDLLNVYAPLFYSKEFKDNLKTVPEQNTFGKRISFSFDIHRFNLRKIIGQ